MPGDVQAILHGMEFVHPTAREAIAFIKAHHYAGSATAGVVRHGWKLDGELVAVSIYDLGNNDMRRSVFGPEHAAAVVHHQRLAVAPSVPHGSTSKFLAASLRQLRHDRPGTLAVVSYADSTVGNVGTIYQACNAVYTGVTTAGNLYFRTPDGETRTMQGLKGYGTWPERRARAAELGWTEHRSDGKHRYVFLLGSAKRGKPALLWDVLPYPDKGPAVVVPEGPKRGGNKRGTRRTFGNVRRLPSGRWQATYAAPDGTRRKAPATFDTEPAAEVWLAAERAAIAVAEARRLGTHLGHTTAETGHSEP